MLVRRDKTITPALCLGQAVSHAKLGVCTVDALVFLQGRTIACLFDSTNNRQMADVKLLAPHTKRVTPVRRKRV